jgi:DNA-binding NtrC family response regulator
LAECAAVVLDDQAVEESDRDGLLAQFGRYYPGTALLYVAGSHGDDNERRARKNGAHYYVSKPLSLQRFSHVLQSFLQTEQAKVQPTHPADKRALRRGRRNQSAKT